MRCPGLPGPKEPLVREGCFVVAKNSTCKRNPLPWQLGFAPVAAMHNEWRSGFPAGRILTAE